MTIVNFTPASAAVGGVLIGTAAALLLWLNGRIAGVSGIAAGLLAMRGGEWLWRALFVVGLIAGAGLYFHGWGILVAARPGMPAALLAAAGVLVGFGTAIGSGCTSGHGVCGIARLSARSLVATATFIVAGVATTYALRHLFAVAS